MKSKQETEERIDELFQHLGDCPMDDVLPIRAQIAGLQWVLELGDEKGDADN